LTRAWLTRSIQMKTFPSILTNKAQTSKTNY
jgi:hypothetical protein